MGKFAKLIELENEEQVLVTVDYNDNDDMYEVVVRTEFEDGALAQIKYGFSDLEKAEEMLDNYSKEDAINFRNEMMQFFS